MDKISFPQAEETIEVAEFGIQDAPGVKFKFWKNPSKPVVAIIGKVIMAQPEELLNMPVDERKQLENDYYQAISQLIIDCNLKFLKFDTTTDAMEAFESPELPIGFMYEVVVGYMSHLYQFNERVKKVLALSWIGSAFGRDGAKKEKQSMSESGETPSEN